MKSNETDTSSKELLYYFKLALGMGFAISFSIAGGGALGYALDFYLREKIGFFFIFGLVLGIFFGFYSAYCQIMNKEFLCDEYF
jgi:hypothetical protein